MSKHTPTHIQDLAFYIDMVSLQSPCCDGNPLIRSTRSVKNTREKEQEVWFGGKGDNTLHDFNILTRFPDVLLPQICIHIPDLSTGVCLLACPLLQNPINRLWGRCHGKQEKGTDYYVPNENFDSCIK